jgi:SnoaL-like domain
MSGEPTTKDDEVFDRLAIRDVLAKYMLAMRTRDVDLMDDVFTPDAVIDYSAIGGTRTSWAETKPWLRSMIDVELFMLYVGDVYPTFDAGSDAADVETTWHGVFVAAAGAPPLVIFGTYADRFVRTPDGWRISERTDHPAIQAPVGAPPA